MDNWAIIWLQSTKTKRQINKHHDHLHVHFKQSDSKVSQQDLGHAWLSIQLDDEIK